MVQYLNNNANSGFAAFMAAQQNNAPKRSKFGTFLWWTFLFLVAWWIVGLFVDPQQKEKNITDPEPFVTVDVSSVPVSNISSDVISANVQGMRISNIDLKNFTRSAKDDKPVTLIDKGFIEIGLTPAGTTAPTATTVWKKSGDNMVWHNSDNIEFSRTITVDGYLIKVSDTIKNNSKRDFSFTPFVRILRAGDNTSSAGVYTGSVAYVNNDIEHHDWGKMDKKSFAYTTTNGYIGFADQYWETIANIDSPDQTMRIKKQGDLYDAGTVAAPVNVAAGKTQTITTNVFAGPRDASVLKNAESAINGIVESVDYATTNNMYSAYLGIKAMFPDGNIRPFYMMNADVFYDASVITALEKDARSNLVVVDMGRYIEESMKVIEKDGRLVAISKQITPEEALGCSIDVYKFGADGGKTFFDRCVEYIEVKKELKKWSEVALNDAFADSTFQACPLEGRWLEIDNHEDLAAAEALFAE